MNIEKKRFYSPLSHVPGEDASFIQDYYNGRTYWNEHRETLLSPASDGATPAYVLKEEAVRVKNYYDDAETKRFEWPDESASSFDNCQMSAAMCCYAADRQANDNNGDCDDPYDENCLGDANVSGVAIVNIMAVLSLCSGLFVSFFRN